MWNNAAKVGGTLFSVVALEGTIRTIENALPIQNNRQRRGGRLVMRILIRSMVKAGFSVLASFSNMLSAAGPNVKDINVNPEDVFSLKREYDS